jgi:hypothetical protein
MVTSSNRVFKLLWTRVINFARYRKEAIYTTEAFCSVPEFRKIRDYLNKIGELNFIEPYLKFEKFMTKIIQYEITEFRSLIFSIFIYLLRLMRVDSISSFFILSLDFVNNLFGIDFIIENAKRVYQLVEEHVNSIWCSLMTQSGFKTESKVAEFLTSFRNNYKNILDSTLVTNLRNLTLSLVGMKFFNKNVANTFVKTLGPAQSVSLLELGELLLESVIGLFQSGERLAAGEKPMSILRSSDPIAEILNESEELRLMEKLTYVGLPQPDKIERNEYMSRLKRTIDNLEILKSQIPTKSRQFKSLNDSMSKLKLIRASFINRMKGETRPVPAAYVIVGPPGIGKSSVTELICQMWSKVKGRKFDPTHVYHRQSMEDFWSGYDPQSQPIIHLSEAGALNKNIAKVQGDNTIKEMLSIIDNLPMHVNMADLESKGNIMVTAEMVVTDTNNASLNADVVLSAPAALRRRFIYIEPKVKEEFRVGDSCRLDQKKALESDTKSLDRWTFDVVRHEVADNVRSNLVPLKKGIDVFELCSYLEQHMSNHIRQQEERINMSSNINIDDYLTPVATESMSLDVHSSNDYEIYTFLLVSFICFFGKERRSVILEYVKLYLMYFCIYILILVHWFWPMGWYQKLLLAYQANKKKQVLSDRLQRNHIRFGVLFLGRQVSNEELCELVKPTSSFILPILCVLSGFLMTWRVIKPFAFSTEGLMVSKERTEEEVDEIINDIEKEVNVSMPQERKKKGNAISWDLSLSEPVVMNELVLQPLEQVEKAIMRNARYVECAGKTINITQILGVCEDLALINYHALPDNLDRIHIFMDYERRLKQCEVTIDQSQLFQVHSDIYLIRLRGCKFRDIRSYFAEKFATPSTLGYVGYIAGTRVNACVRMNPMKTVQSATNEAMINKPIMYRWSDHKVGKCGTPLVLQLGRSFQIVGIHTAGAITPGDDKAVSESVTRELVNSAYQKYINSTDLLPINSEGRVRLPEGMLLSNNIHEKSPLMYIPCPTFTTIAHIENYNPPNPGKSKLRSTPLVHHSEYMVGVSPFDKEGRPHYGAPPFKHKWVDGVYKAPYNNFLTKASVCKKSLNLDVMKKTVNLIVSHITHGLEERGVEELTPVPMKVAVNGSPNDFYMRSMKPSTSGGWAWTGPKRKYSEYIPQDFKTDAFLPIFDIKTQVVEQINAYKSYEDANPINGAQLKDEPRSWKKIAEAKTRVFCMSSYESTIVNRMMLLPFYTQMVENSDIFCTALGINMHSTDVDRFIENLTSFSCLYMEGDWGGFDTSMPIDIGLMANTIVYKVLKHFGYSDEALTLVRGCLSDNLFPFIAMQGEVMKIPGFQPSGKYATAEDNSLRGLCLLVYAWFDLIDNEHFFDNVRPVIYGDDMLAAVKVKYAALFNNNIFQTYAESVYGMEFTNAQKSDDMRPFLNLSEISFLKRNFVYREDLQRWVAPLDKLSIMKTICYYLPSNEVSERDQIIDSCVSAMRELYFHCLEPEFMDRRERFIEILKEVYEVDDVEIRCKFPSFNAITKSLEDDSITTESAMKHTADIVSGIYSTLQVEHYYIERRNEPRIGGWFEKIMLSFNKKFDFICSYVRVMFEKLFDETSEFVFSTDYLRYSMDRISEKSVPQIISGIAITLFNMFMFIIPMVYLIGGMLIFVPVYIHYFLGSQFVGGHYILTFICNPLIEEFFKREDAFNCIFFPIIEFIAYTYGGVLFFVRIPALIMHYVACCVPYKYGFAIHAIFNIVITAIELQVTQNFFI